MRTLLLAIGALALASSAAAQTAQPDRRVLQVYSDWRAKIDAFELKLARDPPKTVADNLGLRRDRSNLLRATELTKDMSHEQAAAFNALRDPVILAFDADDTAYLKSIQPRRGWFTYERYGPVGSDAFLIVQHSHDFAWQSQMLDRLERLREGEGVSSQEYALLFDRVTLRETGKQRYGTQMRCENGRYVMAPLEDPEHVQARRNAIGFTFPSHAEYLTFFVEQVC